MNNQLLPKLIKIASVKKLSDNTKLFSLTNVTKNEANFRFVPGQFVMAGIPNFGEGAFDICSNPLKPEKLEIAVRAVGELTYKMHTLKKGDLMSIRGPYGNGIPHIERLPQKNIVFIGGGSGFVTSRAFIYKFIKDQLYKTREMQIYYGVKQANSILFKNEFKNWEKYGIESFIALENKKNEKSAKNCYRYIGLVTDLLDKFKPVSNATYIMCGPPIMYKYIIKKLEKLKIEPKDIYIFLERRMYCGVGVCQHCAIGPYYVCKDGPVFRYDLIKDIPKVLSC